MKPEFITENEFKKKNRNQKRKKRKINEGTRNIQGEYKGQKKERKRKKKRTAKKKNNNNVEPMKTQCRKKGINQKIKQAEMSKQKQRKRKTIRSSKSKVFIGENKPIWIQIQQKTELIVWKIKQLPAFFFFFQKNNEEMTRKDKMMDLEDRKQKPTSGY